mmetsp:Transcript_23448/g.32876  ORF Transcript_23448/g.32876 Transcript_23448/m.32876 type:complete len:141 (+) Transcript_23448:43-465(+)
MKVTGEVEAGYGAIADENSNVTKTNNSQKEEEDTIVVKVSKSRLLLGVGFLAAFMLIGASYFFQQQNKTAFQFDHAKFAREEEEFLNIKTDLEGCTPSSETEECGMGCMSGANMGGCYSCCSGKYEYFKSTTYCSVFRCA